MIRSRACTILLLLVGAAAAADEPAPETPPSVEVKPAPEAPLSAEAKEHYDAAVRQYSAKQFDAAITEFRAAYELSPRREILFGWAQASRVGGDCPSAVGLYRKFLALSPPENQANAAQLGLRRCEGVLASRPQEVAPVPEKPVPEEKPVAPPPPPPVAPPPVAPPPRAWDRTGALLIGGGAALAAAGVATMIASGIYQSRSSHAGTYGDYATDVGIASATRIAGIVGLAAGGVLALAGVIRFGVRWRRAHAELHAAIGASGVFLAGEF